MRYAITGATGFVGGALARQLRGAGHEVVALVRDPSRAAALEASASSWCRATSTTPPRSTGSAPDVDGLFHVAGWYKLGQRDPSVGDRVNVEGTRNVLAAAQRAGVPRVVYTSTLAVNSDTHGEVRDETYRHTGGFTSHYDRTKAEAHRGRRTFAADGSAGRDRPAGARLRPRRHRPDRRADRAGRGRQAAAGAGRRRGLLGARRRRRGRARAGHGARRARGDVHARRAPRDPGRGAAPGRGDRRHQGPDGAARTAWSGAPSPPSLGALGRVVPVPPDFAAETMRASLATYHGSPAKAERELGWHARPLDTGCGETAGLAARLPGHRPGPERTCGPGTRHA